MPSTAISSSTAPQTPSTPGRRKHGRRVTIPFVDWQTYVRLLKVFEDRPRLRLTYDRGDLEILVPSQEHEKDGEFLARMIARRWQA
jgi:hypothetical protein